MSTPTPEEAFLEYARSTGWDETAVRVVLDTVRKARQAAALEMHERCRALGDALRDLVAGHLNEMTARGLPHEWAPDSPMGRAVRLLEEFSADE
jgi:hypothetical protein